jgi:hypothetical protein
MFRAAVSPFTRHGFQKVFLATSAGTVGVGMACFVVPSATPNPSYNNTTTKCASPYNSGQSNGIDTEVSIASWSWFSLIRPTTEAVHRAARLVATAAVMAADYQLYYFQRKYVDSLVGEAHFWLLNSNTGEGQVQVQRKLEDLIEKLESDLYIAQQEYVDSQPSTMTELTHTLGEPSKHASAISERTWSKRQQKEAMLNIARQLANAKDELAALVTEANTNDKNNPANVHQRNANRLLQLCRTNGGVYVKVGQHLANLDLLLPDEYLKSLSSLFDNAPISSYRNVCHVVQEELGSSPEQLFSEFSTVPFASASLAQVHIAKCKSTGKKLAVKVQHKGLRETSKGDLLAMAIVTNIAEKLFDDFNFGWICEELTPQVRTSLLHFVSILVYSSCIFDKSFQKS